MIPSLPLDTNPLDIPKFYRQIIDNLRIRSGHHEAWHSHRRDPSVCWMCDLVEVSNVILGEMERFISKSALDIETSIIDQEFNSEEDTYNKNDETLPGNGDSTDINSNQSSRSDHSPQSSEDD